MTATCEAFTDADIARSVGCGRAIWRRNANDPGQYVHLVLQPDFVTSTSGRPSATLSGLDHSLAELPYSVGSAGTITDQLSSPGA
jgi:hypothetical protein